jgi:hypothetical protein
MRWLYSALAAAPLWSATIDFARDVFPVFEKRCHGCHGPTTQLGKLRLDARNLALEGGESGPVIRPGDPARSLLIRKIEAGQMPPVRDKLTPGEIAVVREWIAQGANWPANVGAQGAPPRQHWSYMAPVKVQPGPVTDPSWSSHPVDRFVFARLRREGLQPNEEASRETLLRRLSLDLTGLPPTLAHLDAFLADTSANAYEKQIDRLLDSPHFGERWAQWWLDLARYADTNGYESDEPRSHWPWRDWVIRAFNRNLPFDEFTVEQIAGDLIANRTEDQLVATGFHRNTLINSEAGSKDDEFRDAAVKDRIETTATVWLGSTIGCAQCHNHKYDPFTLKDYYRLYAFFNNTAESSIQISEEHRVFHGDRAELDRLRARTERPRKILDTPTAELDRAQRDWEANLRSSWPRLEASWKDLGKATGQVFEPRTAVEFSAVQFSQPVEAEVEIWRDSDLAAERRLDAMKPAWSDWRQSEVFEADSPEQAHATAWPPETFDRLPELSARWRVRSDLPDGAFYQLDGYNCSVYLTRTVNSPIAQKFPVAIGSGQGVKLFLNGKQVLATGALEAVDPDKGRVELDLKQGENRILLKYSNGPGYYRYYFKTLAPPNRVVPPAEKFSNGALLFSRIEQAARLRVRFKTRPKEPVSVSISALPPEETSAFLHLPNGIETPAADRAAYFRWNSPLLAPARAEYEAARAEFEAFFEKHSSATLVMRELPEPRETWVQSRGNFLSKVDRVTPGVPSILPQLDSGIRQPNRLDLARWLVSRSNPLTARVVVNHLWRAIFGLGIVKTGEDFGSQGERPLHPELLDWLAADFMENRWDLKAFLKKIVMSQTYRQASGSGGLKLSKDPENRLLSRGPRFRLTAEAIRDVTLAASGLLSSKIGGPSVFPPLPASVFENLFIEAGIQTWPASLGEDRYRRGMYTFYKRAAPYPAFTAFDAPERAVCTVDRPRSNTPLQALTTLNDEAFVEAARALAVRMQGPNPSAKIEHGFRLTTSRKPGARDARSLLALYERSAAHYAQDSAAAAKLSPREPGLAPWVVVANVLLNLDEAVTKE